MANLILNFVLKPAVYNSIPLNKNVAKEFVRIKFTAKPFKRAWIDKCAIFWDGWVDKIIKNLIYLNSKRILDRLFNDKFSFLFLDWWANDVQGLLFSEVALSVNQFFQKKRAIIFQFNSAVANDERKNEIIDNIREYLEIEHETKTPKKRVLSKTAFFYMQPRVPQQTNSFDCGLYLLKFLEKFLQDFVLYEPEPNRSMLKWPEWFDVDETTKMRQELKRFSSRLIDYNMHT